MKLTTTACFFVLLTALPALAQEAAPAQTVAVDAEQPSLEELLKGQTFTNSAGMVMVKVGNSLWAGKYPVTQAEFQSVMGNNPSQFRGDQHPVDSVSWNDARAFCARLTQREAQKEMLPPGYAYSLPTEAQWQMLMADATVEQAVTSVDSPRQSTAPVGSLGPNKLGLHDMRGNVWVWCAGSEDRPFRVARGGAWDTSIAINLRPEFRWFSNGPDDRRNSYGFRCLLQPVQN